MASSKKIGQLTAIANAIGTDLLVIETDTGTKKITLENATKGKADSLNYDEENNMLQLMSGDTVLDEIEMVGGSGGGVAIGDVSGATATTTGTSIFLKWSDPDDVVLNDVTLASWSGTRVVRKAGSAPTSKNDGTIIVDSKTKNAYSSTAFEDTGLQYGTTYYYRFFPYTNGKSYTDGSSVSATPARVSISTIPSFKTNLTYDGTEKNVSSISYWNNFDSSQLTIGGATTGTDADTYTATFIPKEGYQWSDGSLTAKSVTWTIDKSTLTVPTQSGSIIYDRAEKTAGWDANYDSSLMNISGNTATDAGTHTAIFSLKDSDNYQWTGGDVSDKTANWVINPKTITYVALTNKSKTYNTNEQFPTIYAYDENEVTVGGTTTATNASDTPYVVTFTLTNTTNYKWNDNTTADKSDTWTISRASSNITVSTNSVTLNTSNMTQDVTISKTAGDGTLSVTSSDTSIATVSNTSGNTYNISAIANGTVTITVSVSQTTNYNAVSKTINVTVSLVDSVLNNNDWASISAVSAAGNASSYWDIGACKEITLNGTIGTLSLSNQKEYVYILGFNHNSAVEGSGISFGGFKTALTNGKDVALCDDTYNSNAGYQGAKKFQMNHWGTNSSPYNTNYGGWAACDMRYDILGSTDNQPSSYGSTKTTSATGSNPTSTCATSPVSNTLMAALPSALRSVMKPITKYTDNKGNSSNVAANVTATIDYLPLLSEFEVQGARSYANESEKNSQRQYKYFENGNSKVKYKHSDTNTPVCWWLRSPLYLTAAGFCYVTTVGGASGTGSRGSFGVAPAFLV